MSAAACRVEPERAFSTRASAPRLEVHEGLATQEKWVGRESTGPAESSSAGGFVYDGVRAGRAMRAGLSRRSASARPLPMEDVALFSKEIDNSRVRREVAPEARAEFGKWLRRGMLAFLLLAACFGPRAWLRHSGFRQAAMAERNQQLRDIQSHLQVRRAQLADLRRVERLAAARGLRTPGVERWAWQGLDVDAESDRPTLARSFSEEVRVGGAE